MDGTTDEHSARADGPAGAGERRQQSPTVRRHLLAAELKELRLAAGLTHVDLAERLGWPQAKVSKIESARQGAGVDAVIALADLCRAGAERRQRLVDLAHAARARGWWESYQDVLDREDRLYIGFEAEASVVRTFGAEHVPEPVRTREYAAAVLAAGRDSPAAEDEPDDRRVRRLLDVLELRRRSMADDGVALEVVLSESALRRRVGGPEVLRRQCERLVELAAESQVVLRVVPFEAGALAVPDSFTLLEFAGDRPQQVVHRPSRVGEVLLQDQDGVRAYRAAFDRLVAAALPPEDSVRRVREEVVAIA